MPDLEKAVRYFDSDPNINVSKEIGNHQKTKLERSNTLLRISEWKAQLLISK
jgi:hypothetical protein